MAFASGHETLVAILTIPSGKEDREVDGEVEIRHDQSAIRWDIRTDKKVGTFLFDPFVSLSAISSNGRYAAFQRRFRWQDVYDLTTGQKACTIDQAGDGFVFSGDGSILFVIRRDGMSVWEIPAGSRSKHVIFDPSLQSISTTRGHLALSPDMNMLAVSRFEGKSHLVGLISVETGKALEEFACSPLGMLSDVVVFSPDGRTLATDTEAVNGRDQPVDPLLRLWRLPKSSASGRPR